jgi:predicted flap endonuclease-1-like 5' DNA nuclease
MGRIIAFITGLLIGMWLERLIQPRPLFVPTVKTPTHASSSPPASEADSLTEIKGIGPTFEQALNTQGIHTFSELARQNPDDLAARLGARVTAERIRGWIAQAQGKLDKTDS